MFRQDFRVVRFLAYRDLRRDTKIFLLVMFLLTFSYVNLTFFPAFLNGLANTFQDEIVDTGTSHVYLTPRLESGKEYLDFASSTRRKIELVPGVVGVSEHLSSSATISFRDRKASAQVTALTPSRDAAVTTIAAKLQKGEFLSDGDGEVVLGQMIAGEREEDRLGEELQFGSADQGLGGVQPGDVVAVRFANGVEKSYRVKGIVGTEGFSFVPQTLFMTSEELAEVLGTSDQANAILVRVNNRDQADYYKNLILGLGIPNAEIKTWSEASNFVGGITSTFAVVNLVTTLVGIVIVISTVSIVIFINAARKKRIIGVLKALGMQESVVRDIFLFESVLFGVLGTVLGLAIILLMLWWLALNPIPLPIGLLKPTLAPEVLASSAATLIIVSLLGGFLPARFASRADIIETIKTVE